MEQDKQLQQSENNTSAALLKISQSDMATQIRAQRYDLASAMMPTKFDLVLEQPKVFEMVKAIGEQAVSAQIEFELIRLASLMSVGGNINDTQAVFIAQELMEMYPMESIADFKLCFSRGSMGRYGDIQRMDGITLGKWMQMYLDEKYKFIEDKLMNEKETPYSMPILTPDEKANLQKVDIDKLLEDYKQSIKHMDDRKIIPMTEEEVKREGQEDADPYKTWKENYFKKRI